MFVKNGWDGGIREPLFWDSHILIHNGNALVCNNYVLNYSSIKTVTKQMELPVSMLCHTLLLIK